MNGFKNLENNFKVLLILLQSHPKHIYSEVSPKVFLSGRTCELLNRGNENESCDTMVPPALGHLVDLAHHTKYSQLKESRKQRGRNRLDNCREKCAYRFIPEFA